MTHELAQAGRRPADAVYGVGGTVRGTGVGGRITKQDIFDATHRPAGAAPVAAAASIAAAAATPAAAAPASAPDPAATAPDADMPDDVFERELAEYHRDPGTYKARNAPGVVAKLIEVAERRAFAPGDEDADAPDLRDVL
mgnify:CR=1 FL=1